MSLVDFKFITKKQTSIENLNDIIKKAELKDFKNIIETTDDPLVSNDFNHNPHGSIIDLNEAKVINNKFCRILSWYDNEWGFQID